MLTMEDLQTQIASWTKDFRDHYATALSDVLCYTPIAWYQAIYQFVHNLKNSVSISTDPALRRSLPAIQKCNELFSLLATDQRELVDPDRRELAGFLSNPFSIEGLQETAQRFLSNSRQCSSGPQAQKLFAQSLPWDSFSRARAQSTERYGFQFVFSDHTLPLSDLETHDRSMGSILRGLGAVLIVRKLEPRNASSPIAKGKPDTLVLECHQIAALPKNTSVSGEWKTLG